jgi:FMN phosphatase YigB (HAD superfamily)
VEVAIVADTSSGMVEVYRELGLDRMIETFVISAELGCAKPDPRMYRTASDGLQLDAGECVFVDDSPDCLAGAAALGYLVCGMAPTARLPQTETHGSETSTSSDATSRSCARAGRTPNCRTEPPGGSAGRRSLSARREGR